MKNLERAGIGSPQVKWYQHDSLKREIGVILQVRPVLLRLPESINDSSRDNGILDTLVHFGLQFLYKGFVCLQCAHSIHEVLAKPFLSVIATNKRRVKYRRCGLFGSAQNPLSARHPENAP